MRDLVSLAVFLLATYGLANAIAVLKAGKPIRNLLERLAQPPWEWPFRKAPWRFLHALFRCPPCLAFWIGVAFSVWLLSPASAFCAERWKAVVLDGLAASAFSYLTHVTMEKMGLGVEDL
jgi:hypothetical protein